MTSVRRTRHRCTYLGRTLPLFTWCALLGVSALACFRTKSVLKMSSALDTSSASSLAMVVACNDTLGRPSGRTIERDLSRCTPCMPLGVQTGTGAQALAHARKLWDQRSRAPYDRHELTASCTLYAYRLAAERLPDTDSLTVEIALYGLYSADDSVRMLALREIDSLIKLRRDTHRSADAHAVQAQFANAIWERAQRQLERPLALKVNAIERQVHRLAEISPLLTQLAPIPATSRDVGVSEAEWSARLFTQLAREANTPRERSRMIRMALAPWVTLGDWRTLDSAARGMMTFASSDSAAWPAIALAAFHGMGNPVLASPHVMAVFDSAMRAMPRVDSARYDSFDGILSQDDDEWRYGFLPGRREQLDTRGWAVLDPLWTTPVNELRLERRARVAEADYLYSNLSVLGESGSETRAGEMLVRLGVPAASWVLDETEGAFRVVTRGWRLMTTARTILMNDDTWRIFYGRNFTIDNVTRSAPDVSARFVRARDARSVEVRISPCTSTTRVFPTVYDCAVARRADFTGIPFYGTTDTIDVTIARFRTATDSADIYLGMRMPLRHFKSRTDMAAQRTDSVVTSAWVTTLSGTPLFHAQRVWPLPTASTVALYDQYHARIASLSSMHRVEGMEASRMNGARGAAQFTSVAQVDFPLSGFGMSDPLVAETVELRAGTSRRWTDLTVKPNGGVVESGKKFALAWELYDLTPGPDGRVRWRIEVRREHGNEFTQNDMQQMLSGSKAAGTKVLADESDAPDISYTRDASAQPAILDYLSGFGFGDVPEGKHVVQIRVTDLVSHKSVTRSATVRVLSPRAQQR